MTTIEWSTPGLLPTKGDRVQSGPPNLSNARGESGEMKRWMAARGIEVRQVPRLNKGFRDTYAADLTPDQEFEFKIKFG